MRNTVIKAIQGYREFRDMTETVRGFTDFSALCGVTIGKTVIMELDDVCETWRTILADMLRGAYELAQTSDHLEIHVAVSKINGSKSPEVLADIYVDNDAEYDLSGVAESLIVLYREVIAVQNLLKRSLSRETMHIMEPMDSSLSLIIGAMCELGGRTEQEIIEAESDTENYIDAISAYISGESDVVDNRPYREEKTISDAIEEEEYEEYKESCSLFECEIECPYCGGMHMQNWSGYVVDTENDDGDYVKHFVEAEDIECEHCGGIIAVEGEIVESGGSLDSSKLLCERAG